MLRDGLKNKIFSSEEELIAFGREFGKSLRAGTTLLLYGDLGAGKTTFVKGLAHGFNGTAQHSVSSPTFNYLNIYEGERSLYHFDLYRLRGKEDFLSLGFQEYFTSTGCAVIEWAERLEDLPLEDTLSVALSHDEAGRRLTFL